jgi:tetratricopeptide (TPR) repeat protein
MLSNLGYLYTLVGKKEEAVNILNELTALSKKTYVSPYYFAILYHGLGDTEKAIDFFYKAYEEREGLMVYMKVDHLLGDFKNHPRVKDILKKIGLEK